ncbi:MAG TPA: hypothetical protein DEA32_02860 [Firmicutes bacterium]|nr:hypothetical protein [Bacillota bacterium]
MKIIKTEIPLPNEVAAALDHLSQNGFKAYIVGGAIRDFLLGKKPHDFDICTSAQPAETLSAFRGYRSYKTGIKHGTITVIINHAPIDITTFRTEGEYTDHRHPDSISFTSSAETDSQRRDFTINAFYYYPEFIYDFHSGLEDLHHRTIRAIGDPYQRFDEDALRILRAIRFSATLDFQIEPGTQSAMLACAHYLNDISEERIESEISRIAASDSFFAIVRKQSAIFETIFQFKDEKWKNDLPLVSSDNAYSNLALLLRSDRISPSRAYDLLHSLKYSSATAEAIRSLLDIDESFTFDELNDHSRFRLLLLETAPLDPEVVIRYIWGRSGSTDRDSLDRTISRLYADPLIDGTPISTRDLKITGNDLKRAGMKPGPEFKNTLEELLLSVNQMRLPNERKAQLAWLKKKLEHN